MSYDWLTVQCALDGVPVPPRHTLFTVAGTWASWDQGYPADVARAVNDELYRWQGVGYPASFGPIGNITNPSYAESVQIGVAELRRLISITPGTFALLGYSQGAEVASRVLLDITHGDLQDRKDDLIGGGCFGNPYRGKGVSFPGSDNDASGHGIAPVNLAPDILPAGMWEEYWNPGDLYAQNLDGRAGQDIAAVYALVTQLQFHNMGEMAINMMKALQGDKGLIKQLSNIITDPIGGLVDATRAAAYAANFAIQGTRPHITLWETGRVARAIQHFNAIGAATAARAA